MPRKPKLVPQDFRIRAGTRQIVGFTYPQSTTTLDKAWEKSPGIRIAQCCKAILGELDSEPKVWTDYEPHAGSSALFVSESIPDAVVELRIGSEWVPWAMPVHGTRSAPAAGQTALFAEVVSG